MLANSCPTNGEGPMAAVNEKRTHPMVGASFENVRKFVGKEKTF